MYELTRKFLEDNGYTIVFQEPYGEGERYSATNKKGDKFFFELVYQIDTCSKCGNPQIMYWCDDCKENSYRHTCDHCGDPIPVDNDYHDYCS